MCSRFNVVQLSRERWLWHKFHKRLRILLSAPINSLHRAQKRCSGLPTHTHRGSGPDISACTLLQTSTRYSEVTQKMSQCQPRLCHTPRAWSILNREKKWQKHESNLNLLLTSFAGWKEVLVSWPWHRDLRHTRGIKHSQSDSSEFDLVKTPGARNGEMCVCDSDQSCSWPLIALGMRKVLKFSPTELVNSFNIHERMFKRQLF